MEAFREQFQLAFYGITHIYITEKSSMHLNIHKAKLYAHSRIETWL